MLYGFTLRFRGVFDFEQSLKQSRFIAVENDECYMQLLAASLTFFFFLRHLNFVYFRIDNFSIDCI